MGAVDTHYVNEPPFHSRSAIGRLMVVIAILCPGAAHSADSDLGLAREFLNDHAVIEQIPERPQNFEALVRRVSETPDPESKFGYFVFSIARHSENLLSAEQARQLDDLIANRKQAEPNWHDVRNLVRVRAQIALWDYAAETDAKLAEAKRATWEKWTDLRLAYMFQEFVATEKFQRAAWDLLTTEQQSALRSGKWDKHLKKSTGHSRLFSADKQITRALGKPDAPESFDRAQSAWRERWETMWETYQEAAAFERKREFTMDLAGEDFAIHAWQERYAPAFRAFAEHECEAIRELLHSGYSLNANQRDALNVHRETLRSEALNKYQESAADLLEILSPPIGTGSGSDDEH